VRPGTFPGRSNDETSSYPYGISKLQGEQAALQLSDENFSLIALLKGFPKLQSQHEKAKNVLRLPSQRRFEIHCHQFDR
jgi:hypothetical protein